MQEYWLFIIFLALVGYQLLAMFLLLGLLKMKTASNRSRLSVSVIVAAHNEADRLASCLQALAQQNYPADLYEVILVDDRSRDQTRAIAEDFASRYSHMRCLSISEPRAGLSPKKNALTAGISASSGTILLFTDADCIPGPNWIATTSACFTDQVGLVVGFSPLQTNNSRFWSQLLLIDSIFAAVFYAGSIGWRQPFGATGRNLAYRRSLFEQLNGFGADSSALSGDDDLFLHQVRRLASEQIAFNPDPESVVPATGPETLTALLRQKARHISAAKRYPPGLKLILGCYHLANYLLWLGLFSALFLHFPFGIIGMVLKLIPDWLNIRVLAHQYNQSVALTHFIVWQWLFLIYNSLAGANGLFGKIHWKTE